MRRTLIVVIIYIFLIANIYAQDRTVSKDQADMVAAERAFAKLGYERGFRVSFYTYFADDAIAFTPHPAKVRPGLAKLDPDKFPLARPFNWAPVLGDISAAGDMGYNAGPVVFEDHTEAKTPPKHGVFFSIWKKQADGSWRVMLDLGVNVPSLLAALDAPYRSVSKAVLKNRNLNAKDELAKMLEADQGLMTASAFGNLSAWGAWLDENARIHRSGMVPVTGKSAVVIWLATQKYAYKGEVMFSDIAASGDLGYAYGRAETATEKGYYVRVWKRDDEGNWRMAVDIFSPIPPPTAN